MKRLLFLLAIGTLIGCNGQSSHHDHGDMATGDSTDPNKILYNQVMDIHDEAMPKMETLYNLKKNLKEKIANTPNLATEESEKLQRRIAALDSVGKMMSDWMHTFDLPDSTDVEQTRSYLESQLEEVKRVREAINAAIEKEKAAN